jgi:hypothetical protein
MLKSILDMDGNNPSFCRALKEKLEENTNYEHLIAHLPHRPDGATYSGILTFTATKPVEVGLGHRLHIDNSTLSQFE